jgi:hypothetical protein
MDNTLHEWANYAQVAIPFCVLIGAYVVGKQLRLSRQDRILSEFIEEVKNIDGTDFPIVDGKNLRQWIFGLPEPLDVSAYSKLPENIRYDILRLAMTYNRLGISLLHRGKEIRLLWGWHRDLKMCWINLQPIILFMRSEDPLFCRVLERAERERDPFVRR